MNRINKTLIISHLCLFALCLMNAGWLAAQNVTVSGRILSDLEEVTIEVQGEVPGQPPFSLFDLTNVNGTYSVSVPVGSSFTIVPTYDANPLNGVTTYDAVLIHRHIIGLEPFTSPYQIIAADANHDGMVTTADTSEMRKLILGIYQEFPNNTSWRFVRADYVFPDPLNPFAPPFPEVATFTNISADVQNVDFIGVKIGDVNGNAIPGGGTGGFGPYLGMTGAVRADQNNNCLGEAGEPTLQGWLVTAQGPAGTYHATVNANGRYNLSFPTGSSGNYDVFLSPPNALWSGGDLLVSGECQGEEIIFTVTNTGADMTEPVGYVVIEDIMIQMVGGTIQLGHGESETITLPANGSTWRLEVDQVAYHPGNELTSAGVEGCGTNGQGSASFGIIPLFPTHDAGQFEDEDCQENIGSFDPNDKQGFPRGVGAAHYLPQGQEIEYLIRFQNTGTDTAFNIIVLDTLPNSLDFSTLRIGSSSHPYNFQVLGEGVVQFVFAHIMLPDSNVNEATSHGFVQFAITPRAGMPDGTVIENQAAIFFDFNLPVITNRTWHTLGSGFLDVSNVIFQPDLELSVFPNPTSTTATFTLKTPKSTSGLLRLFDARGRLVRTLHFDHNVFELPMGDLPAGLYTFRLDATDGAALAAGKVVGVD